MKRWVSGAMALIITFSCAQGSFVHARGEADEAVSALVEQMPEGAPDLDAAEDEVLIVAEIPGESAEGEAQPDPAECELTLGDEEDAALSAEVPQAVIAEAQSADAPRYARTARSGVEVLEAIEGGVIAALGADCTVLVLEEAAADWLKVAFCTERGVVTGCVAADALRVLDADETSAYLDALTACETLTAYDGDLNRLLETVACAFADADAEAPVEVPDGTDADAAEGATQTADEATKEDAAADAAIADTPAEGNGEETGEEAPAEGNGEETGEEAPAEGNAEETGEEAPAEGNGEETGEEAPAEGNGEETGEGAPAETADAEKAAAADAEKAAAADAVAGVSDDAAGASEADAGAAEGEAPAMEADAAESRNADGADADASAAADGAQADASGVAAEAATAQENVAAAENVAAEAAFQLNASQLTLGLKETYRGLSATGGSGTVTWTSSDKKVVKVDAGTGVIKGVKKGTATVTATCAGGTASVQVTVKNAPKKIRFASKKISVGAGGAPVQLTLKMSKGSASAGIAYASSNDAVCSVDANGLLTGKSVGTAVITAVTYNNKKATCKVSVYTSPAPASIALPASISIGVKESRGALPLTMVSDTGDTNCIAPVTWKSTNKKVVKVDPNTGAIQAVRKGAATIVAKTSNGLKAKCRVKVKKAPKKVSLSPASKSIAAEGTVQFTVKLPKGSAGGYSFASSDPAVATIDQNGLAKGVGAGTVTITVTTYNGKTATAKLTVGSTAQAPKPDVKVPEAMKKLGIASYQDVFSADLTNEQKLEHVIYNAQNQLGKKYTYGGGYDGGADPQGFDCSGLVYWCFSKIGIKLKNSAYKQGYDDSYTKIAGIDDLKRGDVVCFNTDEKEDDKERLSDHTGIYLGSGYFIHASSSGQKVMISAFVSDSSTFYKRTFSWGRRILN